MVLLVKSYSKKCSYIVTIIHICWKCCILKCFTHRLQNIIILKIQKQQSIKIASKNIYTGLDFVPVTYNKCKHDFLLSSVTDFTNSFQNVSTTFLLAVGFHIQAIFVHRISSIISIFYNLYYTFYLFLQNRLFVKMIIEIWLSNIFILY